MLIKIKRFFRRIKNRYIQWFWKDYYKYAEKTDSNGRWFQQYTEVPFEKYTILGYKTGFLWKSYIAYQFNIKEYKVETIL